MSKVFIAHVEEDADVALEIALGLEEAGYSTWCYEVNSIPGPSYLIQTGEAVETSEAIVVVISPHSIGSRQVTKEVIRAHESDKEFVPVLRSITHIQFQKRQPEWREAVGAAASVSISSEGVAAIVPRIVNGLGSLGIVPNAKADTTRVKQIRRVLDELQEYDAPENSRELPLPAIKPEPGSVAAKIPPAKIAEDDGRRKSWIKPALIAFAIAAVVFIALVTIQEIIIPATARTPVVDDVIVKQDSPEYPPTSPGEVKQDSLEYPLTSPGEVKQDSPGYPPTSPGKVKKNPPEYSPTSSSPEVSEIEAPPALTTIINIPDKNLKAAINAVLGKSPGEEITEAELANIIDLRVEQRGIVDLTGIEYCVNLIDISLGENQISDISALSSLTNLNQLHLWRTQVSDISALSSLTNLTRLSLGRNQISDISALSSLTKLTHLSLDQNQISDISALSSLTGLADLDLGGNLVSDISALSPLTRLARLNLRENQMSDISALSSLTNLIWLELDNNLISDVSALSPLTSLTVLDLRENMIRNTSPLFSLTKLTALDLDGNEIKNIKPLSSLINLNELGLRWNQIVDIQPLVANSGLSDWDIVYLAGNRLSDTSLNVYIPQLEERGVEVSLVQRWR